MINIIDVYESDATAEKAEKQIAKEEDHRPGGRRSAIRARGAGPRPRLRRVPGRLGQDGQAHLPAHLHLRHRPQPRRRASARPSWSSPRSSRSTSRTSAAATTTPSSSTTAAAPSRSPTAPRTRRSIVDEPLARIILTDDYAPVENLLAPVAETRRTTEHWDALQLCTRGPDHVRSDSSPWATPDRPQPSERPPLPSRARPELALHRAGLRGVLGRSTWPSSRPGHRQPLRGLGASICPRTTTGPSRT